MHMFIPRNSHIALREPAIVEHSPNGWRTSDCATRLFEERFITFTAGVGAETSESLSNQLLWLLRQSSSEDITIGVESPGGSVHSGLGIVDTMDHVRVTLERNGAKLITITRGLAASMGSVIVSGGSKGHRYIMRNATIMIHQVRTSGGGGGTVLATDGLDDAGYTMMLNNRLAQILATNCGRPLDEMIKYLNAGNTYMGAFTAYGPSRLADVGLKALNAIEFGIADKVLIPGEVV